jgi:Uma2 family endonuclease
MNPVTQAALTAREVIYPDSDGKPMADNTEQFSWIVLIKEGLEALFAERPDVFVAGDLLWYPPEYTGPSGEVQPVAPDAMVVFGRPKGRRGSYIQVREEGIAPQVVFEVLSPNNTQREMRTKLELYEKYGVEEYYFWDPDQGQLLGWLREDKRLWPLVRMGGHVSPRLGVRFELRDGKLELYGPEGERFLSYTELKQRMAQERQRAEQAEQGQEQARLRAEQERQRAEQAEQGQEQARLRAEQERLRAEQERQRAEQERQRAEHLAARLRELGIDPGTIG